MAKKIFVIAGEISGDVLGGGLMEALKRAEPATQFLGIGGTQMKAAGLESLMPMEELCVMGLVEVIEHLPRLLKLINMIVERIEADRPDVVVTVDLPDFNFRVAKLLKKRGIYQGKIVHYVAPTVWAWRPGRAQKVAQFLDGLMCLFPFEPAYFTKYGLKAEYVGHPLTQRDLRALNGAEWRASRKVPDEAKLMTVMFGSRQSEIRSNGQAFIEAIEYILEQEPNLQLVVPTLPHVEFDVLEILGSLNIPAYVILDQDEKWHAMAASDMAMAVSGTAALELAYAGIPHVIGYRTGFLTWLMLTLLVKVKFAHLANIMLDRLVVPEYLQWSCTGGGLAGGVLKLLQGEFDMSAQKVAFSELRGKLKTKRAPSDMAAAFILGI
jgi:lipid-A-disaccharide synthase